MFSRSFARPASPFERGGAVFCALLVFFCLFAVPIQAAAAGTAALVSVSLGATVVIAGALVALGIDPLYNGFAALVDNCAAFLSDAGTVADAAIDLVVDAGRYCISGELLEDIKSWLVADSGVTFEVGYSHGLSSGRTVTINDATYISPLVFLESFQSLYPAIFGSINNACPDFLSYAANSDFVGIDISYEDDITGPATFALRYVRGVSSALCEHPVQGSSALRLWLVGSLRCGLIVYNGRSCSVSTSYYEASYGNSAIPVFQSSSNHSTFINYGMFTSSAAAPSAAIPTTTPLAADPAFADWLEQAIAVGVGDALATYFPLSVPTTVAEAAQLTQATAQAGNATPVIDPSSVPWHYVDDTLTAAEGALGVFGAILAALPPLIRNGFWAIIISTIVFGLFKVVL